MLCKTTMRAALAHVLGTVGIVGAFGAGAAADHPYAAESLTGMAPYAIKGSPMGEIVLEVKVNTLINSADPDHYIVVNFWPGAQLTGTLPLTYTGNDRHPDVAGTAGDITGTNEVDPVDPVPGSGTGFRFFTKTASTQGDDTTAGAAGVITPLNASTTLTRAFEGDETHNAGVYRMALTADLTLDPPTYIRLDLSENLAVTSKGKKSYQGDLYIYEELGDARAAARAATPGDVPGNYVFHGSSALFEVDSKIAAPDIEPMLAIADVGYERTGDPENNVSTGGPFRGFVGPNMNVGVLATITLNVKEDIPGNMVDEGAFLDATTGVDFMGTVNTAARVVVTSDVAGAFGFGSGAGPGKERTTNAMTGMVEGGAPTAFKVGAVNAASCTGTPLALSAPNADGEQMAINPTGDNPTYSAAANRGVATVTGGGPFQLCVDVATNEVAIPAVGDDRMMDGYMMTVTPMSGGPMARTAGPEASGAAGAIDRNGTTVNISYLSVHPAYNQRLVIVNRGARDAEFWMDDFQTEEGTEISGEIRGTVGAGSRMVIRVQEALTSVSGQLRASGTINLTARDTAVDIMTIQENLGTGQLDTTMYDPQ